MAPREVGFVLCMHTEPTTEPPCPTMLSVILRWLRKVEAIGFIGLFPICQSFSNCGSRATGGSQNPSTWFYPFIHSGYFYSTSSSPRLLRSAPDTAWILCREFHAEAPQAIASEGLVQGLYVAARVGFEPTTLFTKGDESTNEPSRPTILRMLFAKTLLQS